MTATTMLYRPGSEVNPAAWGLPVETLIVPDSGIEDALAQGWFTHPSRFPAASESGPYNDFLDNNVAEIVPLLADLSADELSALLLAEKAGKTRKGLLAEIEKALAAKAV